MWRYWQCAGSPPEGSRRLVELAGREQKHGPRGVGLGTPGASATARRLASSAVGGSRSPPTRQRTFPVTYRPTSGIIVA